MILLAGTTRDMADVLPDQLDYVLSLDRSPTEEKKAAVAKLKAQAARLKDAKFSADTPAAELPFGAPAVYWLSVGNLQPAQTAARITTPMLILQGERDYQATMDDFAGWKKATAGRKNVVLKSYANLNHLFMEGKGKAVPAEYEKEGHVAVEVIEDIVNWLKNP